MNLPPREGARGSASPGTRGAWASAVVAFVLTLGAGLALLPPRISITGGEGFRIFADGFFLTLGEGRLSADPELRLRLTNPRAAKIGVAIEAVPRRPGDVLELLTLDNGRESGRQKLAAPGATLGGALAPTEAWRRMVIRATPVSPDTRPVYRVRQIRLSATAPTDPRVSALLAAILAGLLTALVARGLAPGVAFLAALANAVLAFTLLAQHADPLLPYRFAPSTHQALAIVAALLVLATGLVRPSPGTSLWALAAITAALHGPSVDYGFVNEDFSFARAWTSGELVSTLGGSWDPAGVVEPYYRPVSTASLALNHALLGDAPPSWHVANLILIALAAALLTRVLESLGLSAMAALGAAALWLAHPLSASAIVWVNQRTDLLAILFILGALLGAVRGGRSAGIAAIACLLFGLGSKEIAVVTPALAILALGAHGMPVGAVARRAAPLAGVASVYFLAWSSMFGHKLAPAGPRMENLGEEAWRRWASIPLNLFTPPDYATWWAVGPEGWPASRLLIGILAPVVLVAWVWMRRGRVRLALFAVAWSGVTFLPMLLLREADLHRLGLIPAAGAAIAFACAFESLAARSANLTRALFLIALLALAPAGVSSGAAWGPGGFRYEQLPSWRDSGGERWWTSLTPGMRALFSRQVSREQAFAAWP